MGINTKLRLQVVIYLVFVLCVLLILPQMFDTDSIKTAIRMAEIEQYIRYGEIVYFAASIIFSFIFLLSFMSLYYSNLPEGIFFFPFFKNKYPKGKARVSGKVKLGSQTIPFAKVLIFDEGENEIGSFYTNASGRFKLRLEKGKYIFQAEGFGFEGRATEAVKIKTNDLLDVSLECFSKEDVCINPKSYHYIIVEKYAFLLTSIFSPVLAWFAFKLQSITLALAVIIIGFTLFIVFASSHGAKLIIRNRKGARLRNRELDISDSTGRKKHKTQTDIFGNLIALFSPGIYKISSRGCLPRNVRQSTRTVGSASIKLG